MTSLSKRRKITQDARSDDSNGPIEFYAPGLKPDIQLLVFDQEFHVHSTILKLYSAWFRKFLDSPDKAPGSASSTFSYVYVAVVDDDCEGWGLLPSSVAPQNLTQEFRDFDHELSEDEKHRPEFWLPT